MALTAILHGGAVLFRPTATAVAPQISTRLALQVMTTPAMAREVEWDTGHGGGGEEGGAAAEAGREAAQRRRWGGRWRGGDQTRRGYNDSRR